VKLLLYGPTDPRRPIDMEADVADCEPTPMRDVVLGRLAFIRGATARSEALLTAARDAAHDQPGQEEATTLAALWLGVLYLDQGRGADAMDAVLPALDDPLMSTAALFTLAIGRAYRDGLPVMLEFFDEATGLVEDPAAVPPSHGILLTLRGAHRVLAGRLREGVSDLEACDRLMRQGIGFDVAHEALAHLAVGRFLLGDWSRAAAVGDRAVAIAVAHGHVWSVPRICMMACLPAAGRGDWATTRQLLRQSEQSSAMSIREQQSPIVKGIALAAEAQARSEFKAVIDALQPVRESPTNGFTRVFALLWIPLLTEAYLRTGDLDEAARRLAELEAVAADNASLRLATGWLGGLLAQERGDLETARATFESALEIPVQRDDVPLHRALLSQSYGGLLLSLGDRPGAVEALREAVSGFEALGAKPFLERAAAELERVDPAHKLGSSDWRSELTTRERQVAELVAAGLTNDETAQELYLSVKTIEYHLSHVYSKLGITTRSELRDIVSRTAATPPT
jgi:ATP/maltotriose-dependent transcriptional regulator MalT